MKNNKNKLTDNYDYLSSAMRNISSTYHYSQCARHGEHQPLKYTGKELERHGGLGWHDFEARWYNATSVTTSTADPLTAETPQPSPYAWCAGTPLRNIDPTVRLASDVQ